MKNKEKYDLSKLKVGVQDKDLRLLDNDNKELFKSEWKRYVNLVFNIFRWLEQEYIGPITLTEDEKVILRNVDKKYKWIARDNDNDLYCYTKAQVKRDNHWCGGGGYCCSLVLFNHLFQFIKFGDEEPYNIDELLKQNGVER